MHTGDILASGFQRFPPLSETQHTLCAWSINPIFIANDAMLLFLPISGSIMFLGQICYGQFRTLDMSSAMSISNNCWSTLAARHTMAEDCSREQNSPNNPLLLTLGVQMSGS